VVAAAAGEDSSDVTGRPAVCRQHPEVTLFVGRQRVLHEFRFSVAADVVRAHARGAQVRTRGRVRFVRRTFLDDRVAGIVAVGVYQRHGHSLFRVHRFLVAPADGPAEPAGVRRKSHVRNEIGVHVHVRLAQMQHFCLGEFHACKTRQVLKNRTAGL